MDKVIEIGPEVNFEIPRPQEDSNAKFSNFNDAPNNFFAGSDGFLSSF